MLGAVIGDIVGSVYEFSNTKNYDFTMFRSASNFTDDSILSVAVARWAMTDASLSAAGLEENLVRYGTRFPHPDGEYGGSFHKWLFYPNHLRGFGDNLSASGRAPYNSWGNGSAMRVSSVGWLFDTIEETERVADISAAITHNHPEGIKGAQAVASAIFMARNGATKGDIKRYIEQRYGYHLDTSWEELHRTYSWKSSCQGTVPQAIIAFLESTDYEDAIRKAISMGGDSDTIGCITGGIAEAFYRSIPHYMLQKAVSILPPELMEVILQLAERPYYKECFEGYHIEATTGATAEAPVEYTPERIHSLATNEVFVFGSNLQGMHGGGAARLAFQKFGAEWGVGVGPTGQTYAIPTMQGGVDTIAPYVDEFIDYARRHTSEKFFVTRIGCGIAGFTDSEIAPLFREACSLPNVTLPQTFWEVLREE